MSASSLFQVVDEIAVNVAYGVLFVYLVGAVVGFDLDVAAPIVALTVLVLHNADD